MLSNRNQTLSTKLLPVFVVVLGLAAVVSLASAIEARSGRVDRDAQLEELYVTSERARAVVPSVLRPLIADWYWMRSLQYVGRKALAYKGELQLDDLRAIDARLLPSLLQTTVNLDPTFLAAYEFGAIVLPAIDADAAIQLVEQGTKANPHAWRLYHHLGYIHWQQGDFRRASDAYRRGARVGGAPVWMTAMAARMESEGGSRTLAQDMYRNLYETSDDLQIKAMAFKRLLWLQSLDEQDAINFVLHEYAQRHGACGQSWREVSRALGGRGLKIDSSGAPLDPSGTPYILDAGACAARIAPASEVPAK